MKLVLLLLFVSVVASQDIESIFRQLINNVFVRPARPQRPPGRQPAPSRPAPAREAPISNNVIVDGSFGNKDYHYAWLHGNNPMDWNSCIRYCNRLGNGWTAISINSIDEDTFVDRVIENHNLPWIWTSGQLTRSGWRWFNGPFVNIDWSTTGGFRRPQPDNREGEEYCLSILNKFYQGETRPHAHDVECYHKKDIICERRRTLG